MSFPVIDGLRTMELGTPGEMREWLVGLALEGRKRATAGLLADYEKEGEPLEHVGERLVLVDSADGPVGTIEVTAVEVCRFADVPDDFALAEGEGDLSGDDFRKSHTRFWTREGVHVHDDMAVVLVRFDLVTT